MNKIFNEDSVCKMLIILFMIGALIFEMYIMIDPYEEVVSYERFDDQTLYISSYKGDSMLPTIHDGESILCKRLDLHDELRRGKIVCFVGNYNADKEYTPLRINKSTYIKRIAGQPGDTIVRIDNNYFTIAGKKHHTNGKLVISHNSNYGEYEELEIGKSYTLKDNEYYLLGDNAKTSRDSRNMGIISGDAIESAVLDYGVYYDNTKEWCGNDVCDRLYNLLY